MIIAGYSGIGKTTYANSRDDVLDFHIVPYKYRFPEGYDPSTYTEADKAGADFEFDPEYPTAYCKDLLKYRYEYRHVLIPADPKILKLLEKFETPYLLVLPYPFDTEVKAEYEARFRERGNNETFLSLFIGQWEDRLKALSFEFGPPVYLWRKDHLSDTMLIIDSVLDTVSVTRVFKATFTDVTRAYGEPYDEDDWRVAFLGKRGTLAFMDAFEGYPPIAFFSMDGARYIRTSPGEILIEGETAVIRTRRSIYTWKLTSDELPEKHKELKEAFVLRSLS